MTKAREITNEKRYGQHYTPVELARFLARRAATALDSDDATLTIVDPACGDGELLIAAAEAIREAGHGNPITLLGYDIDEQAVATAHERLRAVGLSAKLTHGDFLVQQREMKAGSIDLIITNPPYVRTQHLGQEASQLLATEFGLTGRVDLTHPFVTVASRLLRPGGVLGLLCSNRFLTTIAGENIRRTFMHDGLRVRELYDLGDTKLFRAAVLPAVIIASKAQPTNQPARFVSAYQQPREDATSDLPLFRALEGAESSVATHNGNQFTVKVGTLALPSDSKTPWRLSEDEADKWLEELQKATWRTFGDIAKIRVGIKSTADKVFLGDNWSHAAPEVEAELLLPLITQSNITPWRIADHLEMRVLYPYDLTSTKRRPLDLCEWPGAYSYLRDHEDQLRGRKYVIDGGREWWEIWVPQKPSLWAQPKIVFPDISEFPRFALDRSGAVVNGNCYWISLDDILDEDLAYLMLAVANSNLGVRFYDETCGNKLYSGKRRWITQYVQHMPLPNPATDEAQRVIALARLLTLGEQVTDQLAIELDDAVVAAFAASSAERQETPREELETTLF
ncbi:MAG: N-6 DNA methylase [Propionibacteriaceae bacterium]